jgi:hypothetical protein
MRDPSQESLIRVLLEAEVCTTGQRKRRERASRNGNPLDELHGTSSPPLRAVPRTFDVALPSPARSPSGGHRSPLSAVLSMTHKPALSPTADDVGPFETPTGSAFHPIR